MIKGKDERLTFPTPKLLMFMKLTDTHFKEYSTEEECNLFGSAITDIIKLKMKSNVNIKSELIEILKCHCPDTEDRLCEEMHAMWLEKFCNAKIKNLLESMERLNIDKFQKITAKTQNLRDGLLSQHVQISDKK